MRRLIFIVAAVALVSTSCSDDGPNSATTTTTTTEATTTTTAVVAGPAAVAQPFVVTKVTAPRVTNGGAKADLTVTFQGRPSYPITMITTARSCPQGGCATQDSSHPSGNPLVRRQGLFCAGYPTGKDVVFDYRVVLIDATGATTPAFNFTFVCDTTPRR